GIRDLIVTAVQTCALPIFGREVLDRMNKATDAEAEGVAIAIEQTRSLKALPGVRGVHVYAIEWPEAVGRVTEGAGLLPREEAKVDRKSVVWERVEQSRDRE